MYPTSCAGSAGSAPPQPFKGEADIAKAWSEDGTLMYSNFIIFLTLESDRVLVSLFISNGSIFKVTAIRKLVYSPNTVSTSRLLLVFV